MIPSLARRPWNPWCYALVGMTAEQWWALLRENRFAIDPPFYDRFVFQTLFSLVNTACGRWEAHMYGAAIESTRVQEAPVFILGHHRSGTTHLHNLLALDDAQFACPTTFQTGFPSSFLCGERVLSRIVGLLMFKRRPGDNMPFGAQLPQEDEFALGMISLCSPYVGLAFPRQCVRYFNYLTFDGASAEETRRWQGALAWFAKKLTFAHRRRLVLKSPYHTGRVRLILEAFPTACFIHIHRDPYAVFRSFRRLARTFPWYTCLQDPGTAFTDERIIRQYTALYDGFFRDKAAIPDGRFHELAFERLEQDPYREIGLIYERFGWQGFARLEPKLRRYLHSIAAYRKNSYPELPAPLRKRLAQAWQRSFETWGYPA